MRVRPLLGLGNVTHVCVYNAFHIPLLNMSTLQTVTFQLVLATNYTSTYGFYIYGETNWNIQRRAPWQRIVVGHDGRDYINYKNIEFESNANYLNIDNTMGNSGQLGVWYFDYNSQESQVNSESLCVEWSIRQATINAEFESVPSACPCTRQQARRDWRFWFANFWGLSSRPNCATLLFSGQQSTIECCYDDDGSLIVGASDGGSYLLYNPLFHYLNYTLEDASPYRYCCVDSERCQLYYKHRPSDDCSAYDAPNPCKLNRA